MSPTTTTTYTLTATNAQGSQTATATVVVNQPQPQLTVCTAVPMTINQGESATLYYQTTNATSVSISPTVGSVSPNGSTVVTPSSNTTYTITANNSLGTATCTVSVQVTPGTAPRIVKFSASPLTISQGATSTLLWAVDNANSVTIDQGVGTVDNRTGTSNVTPQQTTTYTLTATNQFGSSTATATVTVTPGTGAAPTISSFTANPSTSPSPGSAVVLTCLAQNAATVVVSGVGPVNKSGQVTVNPNTQTTYVCVATGTNPAQQASSNLTVPVNNGGGNGSNGPTINITSPNATCSASSGTTVVCQTITRLVTIDLTGTTSPNTPVSFVTTSRQSTAVVLNPTGSTVQVQLSELFGDYFFDVVATDSKGNTSTATVDLQYVLTSVR
ncbi:MAG: hypothetical protein JO022_16005 [Acidobacteriaceae bacterium]|nr:hypothetical protein [Acidobacteriaceae bacterium]